jgi:hypothetical protein
LIIIVSILLSLYGTNPFHAVLQEEEAPEDPAEGEPLDEENDDGWMVPHGYLSDSERDGEGVDLSIAKSKEKEFFHSLKEQVRVGFNFDC